MIEPEVKTPPKPTVQTIPIPRTIPGQPRQVVDGYQKEMSLIGAQGPIVDGCQIDARVGDLGQRYLHLSETYQEVDEEYPEVTHTKVRYDQGSLECLGHITTAKHWAAVEAYARMRKEACKVSG